MACDQHGAEHLGRVVAERPGEAARCLHSAEQWPGEAIRKRRMLVVTSSPFQVPCSEGPLSELPFRIV